MSPILKKSAFSRIFCHQITQGDSTERPKIYIYNTYLGDGSVHQDIATLTFTIQLNKRIRHEEVLLFHWIVINKIFACSKFGEFL